MADEPGAHTRLSALEIHENVRRSAEDELDRPARALWWSALNAGFTIAFSFLAAAYLVGVAPERYRTLATAVAYPIGFVFVVLGRTQLFTENTLQPLIPLLHTRTLAMLRKVLALWAIVLTGNLVGAAGVAWLIARTPMLPLSVRSELTPLALESVAGSMTEVAYLAVFAGWLIALMAWLLGATHSTLSQIWLIWLTTAPIAALGFRHSIAGAVEAFYLAWAGVRSWPDVLANFVVPAVLGNIVGGALFVALPHHREVAPEQPGRTAGLDADG